MITHNVSRQTREGGEIQPEMLSRLCSKINLSGGVR